VGEDTRCDGKFLKTEEKIIISKDSCLWMIIDVPVYGNVRQIVVDAEWNGVEDNILTQTLVGL
jgi:hypothetical protein